MSKEMEKELEKDTFFGSCRRNGIFNEHIRIRRQEDSEKDSG